MSRSDASRCRGCGEFSDATNPLLPDRQISASRRGSLCGPDGNHDRAEDGGLAARKSCRAVKCGRRLAGRTRAVRLRPARRPSGSPGVICDAWAAGVITRSWPNPSLTVGAQYVQVNTIGEVAPSWLKTTSRARIPPALQNGTVNLNTDPPAPSLSTQIRPPWACTMRRHSARPMPLPGIFFPCRRRNTSKTWA